MSVPFSGGIGTSLIPLPGITGGDFSISPISRKQQFRLKGIAFQLTTDSVAANRQVQIVVKDNLGNKIYSSYPCPAQAASSTVTYYGVLNYPLNADSAADVNGALRFHIPDFLDIYWQYTLASNTKNLDPGDKFSAIAINADILPSRVWRDI
jgi:hypothetical protein